MFVCKFTNKIFHFSYHWDFYSFRIFALSVHIATNQLYTHTETHKIGKRVYITTKRYFPMGAQLLAISLLSTYYLLAISLLSPCYLHAISMLSPCYHLAISLLSLWYILAISLLSPCNLLAISLLSPFYHLAISLLSSYYLLAIFLLSSCYLATSLLSCKISILNVLGWSQLFKILGLF